MQHIHFTFQNEFLTECDNTISVYVIMNDITTKAEIQNFARNYLEVSDLLGIELPERKENIVKYCRDLLDEIPMLVKNSFAFQQMKWLDLFGNHSEPPWKSKEQLEKWHEVEDGFFETCFGDKVDYEHNSKILDNMYVSDDDTVMIISSDEEEEKNDIGLMEYVNTGVKDNSEMDKDKTCIAIEDSDDDLVFLSDTE